MRKAVSKSGAKRAGAARDVGDYLGRLPKQERAALEELRKTIKAAAPMATETVSYRMPVYKQLGMLVGFAAFRDHCSFFVMSPKVMREPADDLEGYDLAKAAVHFSAGKPLPASLVRKLVKARIRENEGAKKMK